MPKPRTVAGLCPDIRPRGDRYTRCEWVSSGLACVEECEHALGVVPGLPGAAAGPREVAAVDELADAAEADAEGVGDLAGGHVTGGDVQRFHAFSVSVRPADYCLCQVLQPVVSKYSPALTVTLVGPVVLSLAMMAFRLPELLRSRAQ